MVDQVECWNFWNHHTIYHLNNPTRPKPKKGLKIPVESHCSGTGEKGGPSGVMEPKKPTH